LDKIDAENVFYWSWICSKCKVDEKPTETGRKNTANKEAALNDSNEKGDSEETSQDETGLDMSKKIMGENLLDELLPSLTGYCDYIYQLVENFNLLEY
jgi:hypothetical protein